MGGTVHYDMIPCNVPTKWEIVKYIGGRCTHRCFIEGRNPKASFREASRICAALNCLMQSATAPARYTSRRPKAIMKTLTNKEISVTPTYEIFFVVANSQDDSLPNIVKALDDRLFYGAKEAEKFRRNQKDPEILGVYSASFSRGYQGTTLHYLKRIYVHRRKS